MQTMNSQTLNALIRKIETEALPLYRFCDKTETGLWLYSKEKCEKANTLISKEIEDFKNLFKNLVTNEEDILQLNRNVSGFMKKHNLSILTKQKKKYVSLEYNLFSEKAKFYILFLDQL
jgi:hypothetical protein